MSWFTKALGIGGPTSAESNALIQQWDRATQFFDQHSKIPQFQDTPTSPFNKCDKFDIDTVYYFLKLKTGRYIYLGDSMDFKVLFSPRVFASEYVQFWNELIGDGSVNVDLDIVSRFLKQFLYCKPKKDFSDQFEKGQFPQTINSNAEMIINPAKFAQKQQYEMNRIARNGALDEQRAFDAMSAQEQGQELNRRRLLREEQNRQLLEDQTKCPVNFENYLNTPSNHPRYAILVDSLGSTQDGFALNFYYDKRNANVLSDYTPGQITQMKSIAQQQKQAFINALCQNQVAIDIMLLANAKDNIAGLQNDPLQQDRSTTNYNIKEWKALRWCLGQLEGFVLGEFKRMQEAPVQGQQGQGAPMQGQGGGGKSRSKTKSKSNRKKRNSHRRHSHKHHKHRTPKRR
jgi:hypothetical protein